MENLSPYFDIEKSIDDCERRLKIENARYQNLMSNQGFFQSNMSDSDCKKFINSATQKIIFFDPCFETHSIKFFDAFVPLRQVHGFQVPRPRFGF